MSQAYQDQRMLVWKLRKHLSPGAELQIPPAAPPPEYGGILFNKPWFDYVVCFKRQLTHGVQSLDANRHDLQNTATRANLISEFNNLAACSLQDIHTALDEGIFHSLLLSTADADALLERIITEGDMEVSCHPWHTGSWLRALAHPKCTPAGNLEKAVGDITACPKYKTHLSATLCRDVKAPASC